MTTYVFEAYPHPDHHGHRYAFACETIDQREPAIAWTIARLGRCPERSLGSRWYYLGRTIWFRDERDALEFRLRWC